MKLNETMEKAQALVNEWKEYYKDNGGPHPSSNAYLSLMQSFWFTRGISFGQENLTKVGAIYGINIMVDLSEESEPEVRLEMIQKAMRKAFDIPEPKKPKYQKES